MTKNNHIFLYGPPGSGKTYIGSKLAERLNLEFIDLDLEIEHQTGQPISTIFQAQGEAAFREMESAQLGLICKNKNNYVIALGGGCLLRAENLEMAKSSGQILCLTAEPELLLDNINKDIGKRPLVNGNIAVQLGELLAHRADHYQQFEMVTIDRQSLKEILDDCEVKLGRFSISGMGKEYPVQVKQGILGDVGDIFRQRHLNGAVVIVSDDNVAPLYADIVQNSLAGEGFQTSLLIIPSGEKHKTLASVERMWEYFLAAGVDRRSTILALGGGVVGDLAGFAASSFMRGVRWVVCPTSLLAMVDSSLGGKTGFDLPQGKNLIGAFHAPEAVLVDPDCLRSLPLVETRNGMAEVLKHGIISSPKIVDACLNDNWKGKLNTLLPLAMQVKIEILREDPYEQGRRAILNLGHTVGHALEIVSGFKLRHGEAVALGLLAEAEIAVKLHFANPELVQLISNCLLKLNLPRLIPANLHVDSILAAMQSDKKRSAGSVKFVLPQSVGNIIFGQTVEQAIVADVISHFVDK